MWGSPAQAPTRSPSNHGQDYAWLLPASAAVGYASFPVEFGGSPCVNDIKTAATLSAKGLPPCAAATAEMAVYQAHCAALRLLGAQVAPPRERSFHGVCVPLGPSVVLDPSFAPSMTALRQKLATPSAISVSERSTLLVRGHNVSIEALTLDGALEIIVADCSSLRIRSLSVTNEGWQFDELGAAIQVRARAQGERCTAGLRTTSPRIRCSSDLHRPNRDTAGPPSDRSRPSSLLRPRRAPSAPKYCGCAATRCASAHSAGWPSRCRAPSRWSTASWCG